MAIKLKKGEQYEIDRTLKMALITLTWNEESSSRKDLDLDLSAYLLNSDEKALSEKDFVYYYNLKSNDGAIIHFGDIQAGGTEKLLIEFDKIADAVAKIIICVTIDDSSSKEKTPSFGEAARAKISVKRVLDEKDIDGETVLSFDLRDEFSYASGMIACEITRERNGIWRFESIGKAVDNGLYDLCERYGIEVSE